MVKRNASKEELNAYMRARYAKQRAAGLCQVCSKPTVGYRCPECLAKREAVREAYRQTKRCENCGSNLDNNSRHKCSSCKKAECERRQSAEPSRAGNEAERREQRRSKGVCVGCGGLHGPKLPGKLKCDFCRVKDNAALIDYRKRLRDEVFGHYGGAICACPGCGCMEPDFLTIDHTNNDGNVHRKELKTANTTVLMHWLRTNHWPDGFQILCFNCNHSKSFSRNKGRCIHTKRLTEPPEYSI